MIRGELIEAKTAHVVRDHQREVLALGKARDRDAHAREKVREHEHRFWREIARASQVANSRGSSRGGERALALHRALKTHQVLSHAKGAQREVAGEVQRQMARVLRAKQMVSTFEKLRTKERIVRAHKLAERGAEEVDEVALLNRRAGIERHLAPSKPDTMGETMGTRATWLEGECAPSPQEHRIASPMIDGCPPDGVRLTSAPVERPLSLGPTLALHTVRREVANGEVSLRMGVESSGTPLSCRLESSTAGQVGIRMETASSTLMNILQRERRGIMSRLAEAGIRVGAIEVRRVQGANEIGARFKHGARRLREEDDENVIA